MGQKVNPHGLRVGIIKDWNSRWYADTKDGAFANNLVEDHKIREYLKKRLKSAGVSRIDIERAGNRIKVTVLTAKPGIAIGDKGSEINKIKAEMEKVLGIKSDAKAVAEGEDGEKKAKASNKDAKSSRKIFIDIQGIRYTDLDAQLVAENIADQLEKRIGFRRAMKGCMQKTMKAGALGIKTSVSGRLGGADMARKETYSEGTIPLQTLRANIDYGFAEADTTYGKVGVKTWIYHGEVLPTKAGAENNSERQGRDRRNDKRSDRKPRASKAAGSKGAN